MGERKKKRQSAKGLTTMWSPARAMSGPSPSGSELITQLSLAQEPFVRREIRRREVPDKSRSRETKFPKVEEMMKFGDDSIAILNSCNSREAMSQVV